MINPFLSTASLASTATEVARSRDASPALQDLAAQTPFERAVGRVPAHTPEWTDHNSSDPGVTLVEALAYGIESLAYSDPEFKYVNVRRYVTALEQSIGKGLEFAVFEPNSEPNSEPLWARARAAVTDLLMREWQSGALRGARPEDAFFVRCDRSTMTQDDIDNGRLVVLVGVATLKPAEFVTLRFSSATASPDD